MQVAMFMIFALVMILFGAELFTNAVEWLGKKLNLGQGAVGSVLAALGTALPETAVPITAIAFGNGKEAAQEVGIGGILGAPFLLVTLGSLIIALALFLSRRTFRSSASLVIAGKSFERDMTVFLVAYSCILLIGIVHTPVLHEYAPWVLILIYLLFVVLTLKKTADIETESEMHPLYLQLKAEEPSGWAVVLQVLLSLAAIIGGAHMLSDGVEQVAVWWNIPPFVLSAILIPLATELPETFNSVVWIRQGKDGLALGNITGAMVFQSTVVPAIGIWMTPWKLNSEALLTGGLTLAAGAMIYGFYRMRGKIVPGILIAASLLYWLLPIHAIAMRYGLEALYGLGALIVLVAITLSVRVTRKLSREA